MSKFKIPVTADTINELQRSDKIKSLERLARQVGGLDKPVTKNGNTLLHELDRDDILEHLSRAYPDTDFNVIRVGGGTPIKGAISCYNFKKMKWLVSKGASVEDKENNGCLLDVFNRGSPFGDDFKTGHFASLELFLEVYKDKTLSTASGEPVSENIKNGGFRTAAILQDFLGDQRGLFSLPPNKQSDIAQYLFNMNDPEAIAIFARGKSREFLLRRDNPLGKGFNFFEYKAASLEAEAVKACFDNGLTERTHPESIFYLCTTECGLLKKATPLSQSLQGGNPLTDTVAILVEGGMKMPSDFISTVREHMMTGRLAQICIEQQLDTDTHLLGSSKLFSEWIDTKRKTDSAYTGAWALLEAKFLKERHVSGGIKAQRPSI